MCELHDSPGEPQAIRGVPHTHTHILTPSIIHNKALEKAQKWRPFKSSVKESIHTEQSRQKYNTQKLQLSNSENQRSEHTHACHAWQKTMCVYVRAAGVAGCIKTKCNTED